MKIEKIYISNYKNLKNLEMNFKKDNKILDLVVLTGSNGSGKTRILECILNCFENYINSNYKEDENRLDIYFQENEKKCFNEILDLEMFFKILNRYNWNKVEPFVLGDNYKKDDFFEKGKITKQQNNKTIKQQNKPTAPTGPSPDPSPIGRGVKCEISLV